MTTEGGSPTCVLFKGVYGQVGFRAVHMNATSKHWTFTRSVFGILAGLMPYRGAEQRIDSGATGARCKRSNNDLSQIYLHVQPTCTYLQ